MQENTFLSSTCICTLTFPLYLCVISFTDFMVRFFIYNLRLFEKCGRFVSFGVAKAFELSGLVYMHRPSSLFHA